MVLSGTYNFDLQYADKTENSRNQHMISVFTNNSHYSDSPRKFSSQKLPSVTKPTRRTQTIFWLCWILTTLAGAMKDVWRNINLILW